MKLRLLYKLSINNIIVDKRMSVTSLTLVHLFNPCIICPSLTDKRVSLTLFKHSR